MSVRGRRVNTRTELSSLPSAHGAMVKGVSTSPRNFQKDLQLQPGSQEVEGATPPREEESQSAAGGSRRNPNSPNCRITHPWGAGKRAVSVGSR